MKTKPVWLATDAIALTALMWCIYLLDLILPGHFASLGIAPRSFSGLFGIFTAPLIHGGLWHIVANTLPFVVLGSMVQIYGRQTFWSVTLIVVVVSGLCVWLFSSAGRVVGASGLVFGYWGFLIAYAYFTRSVKAVLLALVVVVLYGTLIFGLMDLRAHISWSAHFFGLGAGVLAAALLRPRLADS